MTDATKHSVFVVGLHKVHCEATRNRVLQEPYNFINGLELRLNSQLRNEIVGVLIIEPADDLELIYELPNVRVVSCKSSGTDHLDLERLHERDILVTNIPDTTADATSDIAIILVLQMARKITRAIQALHNPSIFNNSFAEYFGNDVRNKILGIVGLGSVGQCLAHKASLAFGMQIVYHQRNKKSSSLFPYFEVLNEMLPNIDFLVLCCPLTNSTKHMINLERLKLMKPTAYLINVSRGLVVKTNDLIEALRCGIIAGAGLDVTDPEPLPSSHPLLHMVNVTVLPHIGSFTLESLDKMTEKALENLRISLKK